MQLSEEMLALRPDDAVEQLEVRVLCSESESTRMTEWQFNPDLSEGELKRAVKSAIKALKAKLRSLEVE